MMISNFTLCLQREALLGRGVIGDHLGQVAFFVMIVLSGNQILPNTICPFGPCSFQIPAQPVQIFLLC